MDKIVSKNDKLLESQLLGTFLKDSHLNAVPCKYYAKSSCVFLFIYLFAFILFIYLFYFYFYIFAILNCMYCVHFFIHVTAEKESCNIYKPQLPFFAKTLYLLHRRPCLYSAPPQPPPRYTPSPPM